MEGNIYWVGYEEIRWWFCLLMFCKERKDFDADFGID